MKSEYFLLNGPFDSGLMHQEDCWGETQSLGSRLSVLQTVVDPARVKDSALAFYLFTKSR